MHYFSIFSKKDLRNHTEIDCAFGRQTQVIGNFEKNSEILRKFLKFFKKFLKKIAKMNYFSIFFQKI